MASFGSYAGGAGGLGHEGQPVYSTLQQDLAPYVVELVGTFLLTMTFLCNYASGADPTWAITSNAFMNMALVYSFMHISGANFNPSVTISLLLSGRQTTRVAAKLCLAQITGASCAAVLRFKVTQVDIVIGPNEPFGWYEVGVVEVMYSAMLCFVYLNCAASPRNNPASNQNGFVGLAVGFCSIAGGYAGGAISHTVLNSAIAYGIGLVDCRDGFSPTSIAYFSYDIVGAFLGAGLYRLVRPEEMTLSSALQLDGGVDIPDRLASKISAEFIGTFYLVLTKALNRISRAEEGAEAWSVAAALTALVYALRDVSGAHFNPAVTLAVAASRRGILELRTAVSQVVVQLLAGLVATAVFAAVGHGTDIRVRRGGIHSLSAVALAEGLFTMLTCYVVLSTGTVLPVRAKSRQNNIAGLAYGACHTVGGFSIGNISGSLLNPAVVMSFSELSLVNLSVETFCVHYIVWQLVGAVLAVAAFVVTHPHAYATGADDSALPLPGLQEA